MNSFLETLLLIIMLCLINVNQKEIVFPFLLLFSFSLLGQQTFIKTSALDSYWHPSVISAYVDGSVAIGTTFSQSSDIYTKISKLDTFGNEIWSKRSPSLGVLNISATHDNGLLYLTTANFQDNYGNRELLVKLNENGDKEWGQYLLFPPLFLQRGGLAVDATGNILVTTSDSIGESTRFLCSKLSSEGEFAWSKSLFSVNEDLRLKAQAAAFLLNGDVLFGGNISHSSYEQDAVLVKMNAGGDVLWIKIYTGFSLTDLKEFSDGSFLAIGKNTVNSDVAMMKTSPDGNLIWAKTIPNIKKNIQLLTFGINTLSDGGFVLAAVLNDNTGAMMKFNNNGEAEWAKAYTKATVISAPPIEYTDGSLSFLISSSGNGFLGSKGKLVKTDSYGNIDSCEVLNICISSEDIDVHVANTSWGSSEISYEQFNQPLIFFSNLVMEDYCSPVIFPSPYFDITQEICAGSLITPYGLNQSQADSWSWFFEGGIPNASNIQSPQDIVYPHSGTYKIKQIITYNGCKDSFEVNINVLQNPVFDLGNDTLICSFDEQYELDGTVEGAIAYLWDDSSINPIREIHNSGTYTLSVEDNNCYYQDSIRVTYMEDLEPFPEIFLPKDTLLCNENLPYVLRPNSNYSDFFWIKDQLDFVDTVFTLTQSGLYTIETKITDCTIKKTFELLTEDCASKIYFPNVFSPNQDGINDYLEPLGKNFHGLELSIFDRWGGLFIILKRPRSDGKVKKKTSLLKMAFILVFSSILIDSQVKKKFLFKM